MSGIHSRRWALLLPVGILLAGLVAVGPAETAHGHLQQDCGSTGGGQPSGEGSADDATDIAESRVGDPPPTPSPCPSGDGENGGGGGQPEPTAHWVPRNHELDNGEEDLPQTRTCPGGGTVRVYELIDDATGEVLDTSAPRCPADGPPAEVAPAPPTLEEVLATEQIPSPTIAVNPSTEGITGMESWFWLGNQQTTLAVTAELDGYQVTTNLEAVEWRWTIGDEGTYTATSPGSEAEPAVRHTFDTKGTHTITVEMVWRGSYTYVGFGVNETVDGLEATTDGNVDYTVTEVVGVIDNPDED